jgi:hypothetical protein
MLATFDESICLMSLEYDFTISIPCFLLYSIFVFRLKK